MHTTLTGPACNCSQLLVTVRNCPAVTVAPAQTHMNSDHGDSTVAMVEHYITGGAKVDSATLVGVDRKGMNVLVAMGGESGKLRLPFPSPADDRKAVKDRIVEMTRAAAPPS
eukprot:TRINITY_DN1823_c2_g1_i1.p1 TRINITY_DN1823_c2_g1~~TRINITY_DN1823_c2_g1_i1.p1  ORF type:complete len:112 (-),score=36.80 TRINITY_DN1823_c2_g1_i1:637-972(-)